MSLTVDRSSGDQPTVTGIPAALAGWYAAQSSIRRLWAVEDEDVLAIFVSLEPTSDGDDPLPLWLARSEDWTMSLAACTRREVRLNLIAQGLFEESYVDTDAEVITELNWRDPWS